MHVALSPHVVEPVAAGRGLFIWLLFRALARTLGWAATIAVIVVVAIVATLARRRWLGR